MTSLRTFLTLLLLVAGAVSPASAQRAAWLRTIPKVFHDFNSPANLTATDADGNTYVAGVFRNQVTVGGFTITSAGSGVLARDIFFAKIDSAGTLRWLRQGTSPAPVDTVDGAVDFARGIACDGQGHVYLTGSCSDDFQLGTVHFDSACSFLTQLDAATGTPNWVQSLGGFRATQELDVKGLAAGPQGDVYLSAQAYTPSSGMMLGNLALQSPGPGKDQIGLVAKCNSSGQFVWAHQIFAREGYTSAPPHVQHLQLSGLVLDGQGNITIGGDYFGSLYFGSPASADSLVATDTVFTPRALLARFNNSGTLQWLRGTQALGGCYRLAGDAAGNVYPSLLLEPGTTFGGLSAATIERASYVAKVNAQGQAQWLTPIGVTNGFTDDVTLPRAAVDAVGQLYLVGFFTGQATFGAYTLSPPTNPGNNYAQPYLVACDPAGTVRWARTTDPRSRGGASFSGVSLDGAGHVYVMGQMGPATAVQNFDGQVGKGNGMFIIRYEEAARITGTVYLDGNANGLRDASETAFPRPVMVSEALRPYAATSSPGTGRFTVFADTGRYQLSVPQAPANYYVVQGGIGYQGHLTSYGQTDTARTFGLAPIPGRDDVRLTLTPYGQARRGFANRYRIRIENVGTSVASGNVTATFDPATTYIGAVPTPTQQTGSAISWTYQGLAPFAVQDFDVALTVPLNVALGTVIHSRAAVTAPGDLDPANNVDSVRQVVIGSFDPNDLQVNYSALTLAEVAAGARLDYTIRFQNLGTDTAFTVVIQDTLPAQLLRLGTLQLVSSSHNCTWDLLGNNQLVVRFDNINLPQQSVSSVGSMGFVRFQVRPSAALTPGMLIPNTAHITFDYNLPLATNQVTTLVQTPNGLVAEAASAGWTLYPNPAAPTDAVTLTAEVAIPGRTTVRVADALGRLVRQQDLMAAAGTLRYPLDVRGLTPGLYVVQLTSPTGAVTTQRLVVAGQ